ncbi:MAG: hypothetical protein IKO78_00580 [Bacilli bacterium]|nr:hypothetical protein [Bacilli bacterium]
MENIHPNLAKSIELLSSIDYTVKKLNKDVYRIFNTAGKEVGMIKHFPVMDGDNGFYDPNYEVSFKYLEGGDYPVTIEFALGKLPKAQVSGKHMTSFRIDNYSMVFHYATFPRGFGIEEIVWYRNPASKYDSKEYTYLLNYRRPTSSRNYLKKIKGVHLLGTNPERLELTVTRGEASHKSYNCKRDIVKGTVEEMALKHEDGIKAFKTFERLLREDLPFKENIVPLLMNEEATERYGAQIFRPKKTKAKAKALVRTINGGKNGSTRA